MEGPLVVASLLNFASAGASSAANFASGAGRLMMSLVPSGWVRVTLAIFFSEISMICRSSQLAGSPDGSRVPRASQLCASRGLRR